MKKEELLYKLKKLTIAVDKSGRNGAGTDCVLFKNNMIYAFNQRFAACVPFSSSVELFTNYETLLTAISGAKGDDVFITKTDEVITVKGSGKQLFKLVPQNDTLSPILGYIYTEAIEWRSVGSGIKKAVELGGISAPGMREEGVFFTGSDIYSTDTFMMSKTSMDSQFEPMWMPVKSMKILNTLPYTEMATIYSWVHVKSPEGIIFSGKSLNAEEYPLESLTPVFDVASHVEEWEEDYDHHNVLLEMLTSAIPFADSNGEVELRVMNRATVEAKNEKGEFTSDEFDLAFPAGLYKIHVKKTLSLLTKEGMTAISVAKGAIPMLIVKGASEGVDWVAVIGLE